MISNHLALNLVTRGLLNISNVTNGFVFQLVFKKPKKKVGGGSGAYDYYNRKDSSLYYDTDPLYNEIHKHPEEEIDYIKVFVNWSKNKKFDKKLEAKKIEKYINAEIFKETNKNIKIEIIKNTD